MSLGQLIALVLKKHDYSLRQFADQYGFNYKTVWHWKRDEGGVNDLPYGIIEALADLERKTPAEMFKLIDIDVLEIPMANGAFRLENLRLPPLVSIPVEDITVQEAIKIAHHARWLYCYEGRISEALNSYERAAALAEDAEAERLAIYLKIYVGNLCEMTGQLDKANRVLNKAKEDARRLLATNQKAQNDQLVRLATRFINTCEVRLLWTNQWARGVSPRSIEQGEALIRVLKDTEYYQMIFHMYTFLARCSLALGNQSDALHYMELAQVESLSLSNPRRAPHELFLDVAPTRLGRVDYSWREDQTQLTMADLLIALGKPDEAFSSYLKINTHRDARVCYNVHNWFNRKWQQTLKAQTLITEEVDPKLAYLFDQWLEEFEEGGNIHATALNVYVKAETDETEGKLWDARRRFQIAEELAHECSAEDLYAKSVISTGRVAVAEGNKPLAITKLNMIEVQVKTIRNPLILQMHKSLVEAVAQM